MSNDTIISVRGVSKRYRVFESPWARLLSALSPALASPAREVWALRDVSFEVLRGEAVGIIGRNGSGKSTLLEIIAGTLRPTEGAAEVRGRVAALLELGSGFNPECTGRENVFLNGLLLGLTRAEIAERFDAIAGFADIGDVLDLPVKTYSSGMLVRLAFSVQVALEPEILIVDEALSVGDFFFQQKCFGHLRRMREHGLTLLFVSHDMGTVRNLCQKALYLRAGQAMYWGDSNTAIRHYLREDKSDQCRTDLPRPKPSFAQDLSSIVAKAAWSRSEAVARREGLPLLCVTIEDRSGAPISSIGMGDTVVLRIYFLPIADNPVHISLAIKNKFDQIVCCTGSNALGLEGCLATDRKLRIFELEFDCMLEAGEYSLQASVGRPFAANRGERVDESDWFGPIHVHWDYDASTAPFLGMFGIPARGRFL